jgi:hypothetical protein
MIRGRQVVSFEEDAEVRDFVVCDVAHAPKGVPAPGIARGSFEARVVKTEAALVLTRLGWSAEKIGIALDWTGRNVRKKRRLVRELARDLDGD